MGEGFEALLTKAVAKISDRILFHERLEQDARYQRCAAVLLAGDSEPLVALAFLNWDGVSATFQRAGAADHPLDRVALKLVPTTGSGTPAENGSCG